MDKDDKSNWMGNGLWALGGFVLGFGAGYVFNDATREPETAPGMAKPAAK